MVREVQQDFDKGLLSLLGMAARSPVFYPLGLILLGVTYYLLAMVGLLLESWGTGISFIWLASGFVVFLLLVGGARFWPVIPIGVFLLAHHQQAPGIVAITSATGYTLQAIIPVLLLRRYDFRFGLERISCVMRYVALAVITGPLISAVLGMLGYWWAGLVPSQGFADAWWLWWLANSFGALVVGAFLLVWYGQASVSSPVDNTWILSLLLAGVVFICFVSTLDSAFGEPALLLFAIVPTVVMAAVYCGQRGATLVAFGAALAAQGIQTVIPESAVPERMIGVFSISAILVWVSAFSGLVVAAAYSERGAKKAFAYLAEHDGLTSLINRHAFELRFTHALESARLDGRGAVHALMFMDLDNFKQINDEFGHSAGDSVLKQTAAILLSHVRGRDTVARIGGDEFAVLLEHCSVDQAEGLAKEIISSIRGLEFSAKGQGFRITASIGLVPIGADMDSVDEVMGLADAAHYFAKRAGKDQVHVSRCLPESQ